MNKDKELRSIIALWRVLFATPFVGGVTVELFRCCFWPELDTAQTWLHVLGWSGVFGGAAIIAVLLVRSLHSVARTIETRAMPLNTEADSLELDFLGDLRRRKERGVDIKQESLALVSLYGDENVEAFFTGQISPEELSLRGRVWAQSGLREQRRREPQVGQDREA